MSYLGTDDLADLAIMDAVPFIQGLHDQQVISRLHGYAIMLDPTEPPNDGFLPVLAARVFGERSDWEHPYEDHATLKAQILLRALRQGYRLDSTREVQHLHPWLLEAGDTPWEGGVLLPGAPIVAYSGVQSEWDEAIATTMAACFKARCFGRAKEIGLLTPLRDFVGAGE